MSATPVIVTYKNFRNIVQCKEYANIYDDVTLKFSNCSIFPWCITLQYEDKELHRNDFIDIFLYYTQRQALKCGLKK